MNATPRPRRIALDFDGTVFAGEFTRADEVVGPAHPGAIDWLREQLAAGVLITLHTCRLTPEYPGSYWKDHADPAAVQAALSAWLGQWLTADELAQIEWWTHPGKPGADMYLDDKGFRFSGVFPTGSQCRSGWTPEMDAAFEEIAGERDAATIKVIELEERVRNLEHTVAVLAGLAAEGDIGAIRMHFEHVTGRSRS